MADGPFGIKNPFAPKPKPDPNQAPARDSFMEPQPGDPGYVPLPPVPKGFGMEKSEPRTANGEEAEVKVEASDKTKASTGTKKVTQKTAGDAPAAKKLPVMEVTRRGLDLLREDLLKNAPDKAGVGRQDVGAIMKPMAGEPGYKPAAYQTVRVSELGISPFPDDSNAVGKVGGVDAVKKAALDVKAGKTAKEIKKKVLKIETKAEDSKTYDIPDYLKPLPEDTPRKGYTWKNYVGR